MRHFASRLLLSNVILLLSGASALLAADGGTASRVMTPFGRPPLSFEVNRGQAPASARFVARTGGRVLYLENDAATLTVPNENSAIRLRLSGANSHAGISGIDELPGRSNYFPTGDPQSWHTSIPTYARVKYQSIYDGTDLIYYAKQGLLEYDFVVSPGSDPARIAFDVEGADSVQIDSLGTLILKSDRGDIHFDRPQIYQRASSGDRQVIPGRYVLRGERRVGFEIASYDRSRPLIIDPVLTYSTFVGISGDQFTAATADSSGNLFLAGKSSGALAIEKLSSDGTTQVYHNTLGSGFTFNIEAIAVDAGGQVYITGTAAQGLPTTSNAFQTTAPNSSQHAFMAVVNAAGTTLSYCSYLTYQTGNGTDLATGIAVDSTGKVYITGYTSSANFPTTSGVFQTTASAAGQTGFVAKFDPTKSGAASLVYSTYLGGPTTSTAEYGIAVDSSGSAYVTGIGGVDFPTTSAAFHYTGFLSASGGVYVTKLNATATAPLAYSAYLGYQNQNGTAIAVDGSGDAYVTGFAQVSDFPTTTGAYETNFPGAFVSELNSTGSSLVYSTFLVGPSEAATPLSVPASIALQPACASACNAYVAGFTTASDFPAVNAIQSFNDGCATFGCSNDAFLVELSSNGSTAVYSTYLGGSSDENNSGFPHVPGIAVTSTGDTVVAGITTSTDFPVTLTTTPSRSNFAARITAAASAKAVVSCTGLGTANCTPATLTFTGSQPVPVASLPQTITFRNMGSATMTVSSVAATGDFSQTNTCGSSLSAGASCAITVTFTPTHSGSRTGTLTVTGSATNSPTAISLSGTGLDSPYIMLSPATLLFGNPPVGSAAAAQSVTLSNVGDQALAISGYSFGGTNPTDFFETNNCPASLASNSSCIVTISFLPTQVGFRSASLSVSSNTSFAANSTINLSGTGAGVGVSQLTLSGAGLSFASQAVGTTSARQSIIATNTGNVPVAIASAAVTGAFVISGNCIPTFGTITVNPGGTCSATVQFAPTTAGANTGTLTLTDNTTLGTHSFTLSGTGVADSQTLSITPSSLTFADTSVGQVTRALNVILTNTGTFNVTYDRIFTTGDYQLTTGVCAPTQPTRTCSIGVLFKPTAAGTRSGSITIIDTATGSPHTVNLSGKGVTDSMTATISPANLSFGTQPVGLLSSTFNAVLANTGNIPINPVLTFTGANPGDFQQTAFCGTVAPARTCSIPITFTPTATGSRTASLTITDEAGTQTVSLSGTGQTAAFSIAFAPSAGLTYQNQAVNIASAAQNLQVVNTGNEPITFNSVLVSSGPYTIQSNACFTINPNTGCAVGLTFTPTGTGAQNGTLTFTDNATGSPQVVNLTGSGVVTVPTVTTNPSGLAFASQVVNTTSNALGITLNNTTASAVTGVSVGAPTGNFALSSNFCGTTINPNSGCTFNVTFTPTASGTRTGTVTVTDSAGTQTVNLAGYGSASAASAVLRETSLTFPNQVNNTTSGNQNISLANTGNVAVIVSNVAVGGTNQGDFAISNGCTTVNPGLSCNVGVTFTPSAAGNRTATVTITDNAPGSPRTITVSGKGLTPVQGIVVDRPKLIFPSQVKATSSSQQNITVTNTGNFAVTISSVATSGTNAADYAISNSCPITPSTLPPAPSGNTCTIGVTFTPSAAGTRTATITITDSSPTSPHTVTLTGTGVTPAKTLVISPTTIAFDPQVVNTSSGFTQTVTVYNTGNAAVTFSNVTVTGNFSIQNFCTGVLQPGTIVTPTSCTIGVQFTPASAVAKTGTLTITDDATGSPQKVSLSGTGITASQGISISQTSVVFDQQVLNTSSPPMVVYYYNQSNVAVNITSVTPSGTDFTETSTCSGSITPLTFCKVTVTFKPTAMGVRTGSVVIVDSAPGSPRTISLSGTGVTAAAPAVTLSPSTLSFGNQTVGVASTAQNVNLTNSGETNLTISGITLTGANPGDYSIPASPCPATLTAGFSCTIPVTFKPTVIGSRAATLSISDNASGSPQTVSLTGTGVQGNGPAVTLSPTSLTFSNVPVNTTSAAQSSTLTNSGQAALTISSIAVTGGIPGDFTLFSTTCPLSPSTVAVNGTCTISVKFAPGSVIDQTAAVTITDNAVGSPQALNLIGNGTAPAVNLSTTSLTFAARTVGTTSPAQTVTLQNVGNLTLNMGSVTAIGDFAVTSNNCTGAIGAGLTCTFGVTFKPTATGARTGFVMIGDNAGDSPQFISLSGTGQ